MADWKPFIVKFHTKSIENTDFALDRNTIAGEDGVYFDLRKYPTGSMDSDRITFRSMNKMVTINKKGLVTTF